MSYQNPVTLNGHRNGVYCVRFSPDGNVVVSGAGDHTVRLWHLPVVVDQARQQQRRQLLAELDDDRFSVREHASWELARLGREVEPILRKAIAEAASLEVRARLRRLLTALRMPAEQQHRAEVRSVAFSSDGRFVASGSRDETIKLWNARTNRAMATLDGQSGTIWSVTFSPDGSTLASGGLDNSVRLWNVAEPRLRATLKGHEGPVHGVAFSPDGTTLASAGSFDRTVRLWNAATGVPEAVLREHGDAVLCVAFSPDGRMLASAGYGGTIRLWGLATSRPVLIRSFQGHQDTIRCVAFAPNGTMLATGGDDNALRLWEIDGGRLVAVLADHAGAVTSVSFSPDGRAIATGSLDDTVKVRSVPVGRG
ncbi:MAG: WD40 repeat domain-containing protein [Pirellulales bacterium]|nr:WD40 repeat domain-containing protein [Pirellulales bacterium]